MVGHESDFTYTLQSAIQHAWSIRQAPRWHLSLPFNIRLAFCFIEVHHFCDRFTYQEALDESTFVGPVASECR